VIDGNGFWLGLDEAVGDDLAIRENEIPFLVEFIIVGAFWKVESDPASLDVECRPPGPHRAR
jgi:hypothetical protein